jgi:hypothetical protein
MKKVYLLCVFVILTIFNSYAQRQAFSSKDEYKGDWELGASWIDGVPPGTTNLQNVNITTQGYITRNGSLSFENGADLIIDSYDTLVVMGDLEFKNNTELTVREGAVLVVTGNFISNNNIEIAASGSLAVLGDFTSGQNTDISVTGDGAVYVVGEFSPGQNTTGVENVGNKEDLQGNESLADFINEVSPGSLPVNLLYFTAIPQQNVVKIEWASSKAWDFSHYELERSADGKDFEYLAHIDAEENTDWVVNYAFEDLQPLSGISYYRLKAVDIDGSFEYKGIEVVQFVGAASLKAYPNPATNGTLNVWVEHGENARVSLKDNSGRTVYAGTMQNAPKAIDTSSLQPGLYVLIVEAAGAARQTQVIIQ